MSTSIRVALVGDRDSTVTAHRAISLALDLARARLCPTLEWEWVGTESIDAASRLESFDGVWCIPASPYRSMKGALCAIRFARETARPFLGTCGGFQHAILEYAQNVLGWEDAAHGEESSGAGRVLIAPLSCSLVGVTGRIVLRSGTVIANAYRMPIVEEAYHCSYGLAPEWQHDLLAGSLRRSAVDPVGDVRAVELRGHPFYVATLFQPERAAFSGVLPPLVASFVRACAARHDAAVRGESVMRRTFWSPHETIVEEGPR